MMSLYSGQTYIYIYVYILFRFIKSKCDDCQTHTYIYVIVNKWLLIMSMGISEDCGQNQHVCNMVLLAAV